MDGTDLEHPSPSTEPTEQAGHRQARVLALSFSLADANNEDYPSALRWLEVVEQLDGALPPGYTHKRVEWPQRARLSAPRRLQRPSGD